MERLLFKRLSLSALIVLVMAALFFTVGCSKSDNGKDEEEKEEQKDPNANDEESIGNAVFLKRYIGVPRNVKCLSAVPGVCAKTNSTNGYKLMEGGEDGYIAQDFSISIQTGNKVLNEGAPLTFTGIPACFDTGYSKGDIAKYSDNPLPAYDRLMDSIFRRNFVFSDSNIIGGYEPPHFLEYRTDAVEDISIVADVDLFSRRAGEDLSDMFEIVLFYMNLLGEPNYIISSETSVVEYAVQKGMIELVRNNSILYISNATLYGKTYEPFTSDNFNLKEWAQKGYYADPAMYVKFKESPAELPVKTKFTVTLKLGEKEFTSATPEVEIK